MLGLAIVVGLVLMAIFASWITSSNGLEPELGRRLLPMSSEHWFGTDHLGQVDLPVLTRGPAWLIPQDGAGDLLGPDRPRVFRKHLQMVFQDPFGSLHPRHTVDQTLREPAKIHKLDRIEERIVQSLEEVGLDATFRFRYPHQISGGQRQRIAVARALIIEPRVVLMDEPTSALDVSVQAEVLNLLSRLKRERGLTYILVSHDFAVVSHMCDRLSVMRDGLILETLGVEQLRANEPSHSYTQQLLRASVGYDRDAAEVLEDDL